MRCPFCGHEDTQVKDSRPSDDNASIRRRRFCTNCAARFTTFERAQLRELTVLKADGSKQPFDRDKLARSMKISLRKRPIDDDKLEQIVNSLVRQLETLGENEVSTRKIGELVMETLFTVDHVGYVRYASVYKDFRSPADFDDFVEKLRREVVEASK